MTPEAFLRCVERMRTAQRAYFRTRSSVSLRASKRLEKAVDDEIERTKRVQNKRLRPACPQPETP